MKLRNLLLILGSILIITTTVSAQGIGLVNQSTGAPVNPTNQANSSAGNQVINLLRNLSVITLSDILFQNPSFKLLRDQNVPLPPITTTGRRNPFAISTAQVNPVTPISLDPDAATASEATDTVQSSEAPAF